MRGTVLFIVLFFPLWLSANTTVSSNISTDTTWNLAGSPYDITKSDFEVETGATLTIDPGVTVNVSGDLRVEGTINATGTSGQKITFDAYSGTWNGFKFNNTPCSTANNNTLHHTIIQNVAGRISVSRQNLSLQNSQVTTSGNVDFFLYSYSNQVTDCGATITLSDNTLNFTTSDSDDNTAAIYMDGSHLNMSNNTLTIVSNGNDSIHAIRLDESNTSPYNVTIDQNNINITVNDAGHLYTYGIRFIDGASGDVTNNTLNVQGKEYVYGIYRTNGTISGNTLNISSNDSTGSNVYGIYSNSTNESTDISSNRVKVTGVNGNLYGCYCQAGLFVNNTFLVDLNLTGSYGSVVGFLQRYYGMTMRNNSIYTEASSGSSQHSMYFSTHYNSNATITLKNNIFMGSSNGNGIGLFNSGANAASVLNSYNLVYGYETLYSGTNFSAGTGALSSNPLFDDVTNNDFTLQSSSPAIDQGDWSSTYSSEPSQNGGRINMGAYGNTSSAQTSSAIIVAPEITNNSGNDYTSSTESITLSGNTSSATQSIKINGSTLNSYSAGSTTWSSSVTLDNGSNTYSVVAIDGSDNQSSSDSINITFTDSTAPSVSSVSPNSNASSVTVSDSIQVTFSENMDSSTIDETSFSLDNNVSGTVTYNNGTASFNPDEDLDFMTQYTVTLTTQIKDENGNALAENYTWTFRTETNPEEPSVLSSVPADQANDVSPESSISFSFSEEIDESTLNLDSFQIEPEISGTLSYENSQVTFSPDTSFAAMTTYTITLTGDLLDAGGQAMSQVYTLSFTTGESSSSASSSSSSGGCQLSPSGTNDFDNTVYLMLVFAFLFALKLNWTNRESYFNLLGHGNKFREPNCKKE